MNSPWHRSRLTWIGAIVLALLPVGWCFTALRSEPPVTVQSTTGIRYLPEETVARAGWFPGPAIKRGDGWWFLFIPYWLIILVFPVLWFGLVWAWQRRKRRSSPL